MRARLALLVGFVVVVSLLGFVTQRADRHGAALQADPAPRPAYDRGDRQAVIDAFYDTWLRNQKVPLGWTGSVSGCKAGQVSDAARAATLGQINYFRVAAGLRPVTFDTDLGRVAQRTALMMDANNQLSHDPPDSWACRTDAADRLAGRANLSLGGAAQGAGAISRYVTDSSHIYAGHRRWLLNPRTAVMAAGSTAQANAVVVVGMPQHSLTVPRWVPWPSAGYFPSPLEPNGRWSLSASNPKTDFAKASVTVKDASGHRYPVYKHPVGNGFGPRTLVWRVSDLRRPAVGENLAYSVRVSGIYRYGEPIPAVSYTVTMVKPDRVARVVESPEIRGTFAPGEELVATTGTWYPRTNRVTFQWKRDGVALQGQTYRFYRVQSGDVNHTLSVVVRAEPPYYLPGQVVLSGRVRSS
jgi:uncharacterized protein YkwD